ncbi:MAG: nitrate ABC transporter ATP-binding protein [Betaproteobacteria bacterium RIFCSPLOWO2_02_FULL_63_19]|nr:MAG: nitrate ABC transporter ATP-binding protein [Betaproteobacteria bacterium RIFCSPLOWO2_02_FULL_63_19]
MTSGHGSAQASAVLTAEGIGKRFGSGATAVTAIDEVTLSVKQGELISVIGPSGCGKSTLFNIIGGLITDYEGEVRIDGRRVSGCHPDIGMVFQEESTFPWRTALENVEFPLEVRGLPAAERRQRAQQFLGLVGLTEFADRYPGELSGGMKARTAIARTLAAHPKILLMDEPFGALDEQTRLLLGDRLSQIHRELGQTTLLITHSITEAVHLSDRVVVMSYRPGRIKRVVDVDLPRPRSSEIIESEQFGHLVASIWHDLREEASRGLAADEASRRSS